MNFILVWVLVSVGTNQSGFVQYSEPLATQNECIKLKARIDQMKSSSIKTQCVQITMGVAK